MHGIALAPPLTDLDDFATDDEQLWYVAHPVHPTKEEVVEGMRRLRGFVGGSPGDRERREVSEEIIRGNIVNAKGWMAWLIWKYPVVTFIAPWIATLDGGGDDDLDPAQRERGLRDCCRTVKVCHGIVLIGGRVSGGMAKEASHARAAVDLTSLGRTPPPHNRKESP